ncbi:DUF362 domain-containing protein [Clostridium sp. DL1XJH146]
MSKVSIVECKTYDFDEVKRAIKIAVDNSNFPDVSGKKVLLKPNILSDAAPEKCITTHPVVLKAVIELVKEKGAEKIYVGDSPALQNKKFKPKASKLIEICEEEEVEWVDFTKNPITKTLPFVNHNVTVASIIDNVDLSISLSKFKTHEFMYATGSMKNMFGLMPSTKKSAQHLRHPSRGSFAKLICGISTIAKVEYTIMDAVMGMEGAGPANGTPREVGKIIAGNDPLAVDIAQAIMMGYDPVKMPVIKCALENSITEISSIEDVEYPLFNAKDLIIKDYKRIGRNTSSNLEGNEESEYLNRPAPEFDDNKCIYCKKCINICPANALALENGQVAIDESKCIRCYCCHEVCPVNAISISH